MSIASLDQSIRDIENLTQWITWIQRDKTNLDKEEAKLDARAKVAINEVDELQPKVKEWAKAVSEYATISRTNPYRTIIVPDWEKKRQAFETQDMDPDTIIGWLQKDYKRDVFEEKRMALIPKYDQVLEDVWKHGLENTKLSEMKSPAVDDYKAELFLLKQGVWSMWKLHDAMIEEDNTHYLYDMVYEMLDTLFEQGDQSLVSSLVQGGVEGILSFWPMMRVMLEQKYTMKETWQKEAWARIVRALPLTLQEKVTKQDLSDMFKQVWKSTKHPYIMQVMNSAVYSKLRPIGIWPTVFATLPEREDAYLFLFTWIAEVLASDVPTLYMQTLVRWIRAHVSMTDDLADRLRELGY